MTWPASRPRKTDVVVAKNYLNEQELGDLNLIVSVMRSESGQKETPGPLNRKRSRKGSRGQHRQAATTELSGQIHFSSIKRENLP